MATADKMAIQRLVIGPDGTSRLMLVDLLTFEPVVDPTGYMIVGATQPPEPEEVADIENPDAPNPIQSAREQGFGGDAGGNANATPSAGYAAPARSGFTPSRTNTFPSAPALPGQTRTQQVLGAPRAQAPQSTAPSVPQTSAGFVGRPSPAGVPQSQNPNVSYASVGPNRPNRVANEVETNVANTVGSTFGPQSRVDVTSGDVNPDQPGWTADHGKYSKSHRHTDEMGMDFKAIDPKTGMPTRDPVAFADMAMNTAAANPTAGIGFGKGYMGEETMHVDYSGKGGVWGGGFNQTQLDNIGLARETGARATPYRDAPTPTANPGFVGGMATRTKDDFVGFDPFEKAATVGELAQTTSKGIIDRAKSVAPSENKYAGVDVGSMTPAEFANAGFASRTTQEQQAMGFAAAGELSRSSHKALAAGVPEAQAEFANVLASMENRAAAHPQGLAGILSPSQYNSLMATPVKGSIPLDNTKALFSEFNQSIMGSVKGFFTGAINPTQAAATHYFNPDIVTPGWSRAGMFTQVGQHTFGSLPGEYTPGSAFMSERGRMANAQISDTRGFDPGAGMMGAGFAGRSASSRGTFGTANSPGVGRSSFDSSSGSGFASRSDRGSFGTSSSPGVGRSSYGGNGGSSSSSTSSGSRGGVSSSSGSRSGGIGSDRGASNAGGSSGSKGTGTGRDGRTGSSGSPTNDGKGGSKSPGGGF